MRHILRFALPLVVVLLAVRPAAGQDVAAPDATAVAGWVQAFYAGAGSFHARFTQSFWLRATNATTRSAGEVRVSRPGRFRMDYAAPQSTVIVRDDGPVIYYTPGDGSFPGQVSHVEMDSASVAFGILLGTARLDRDFIARRHVASSGSPPAHTVSIRLTPRVADRSYRTIILYVSDAEATRGRVERLSVESTGGDFNTYSFEANGDMRAPIEDSVFRWEPPAGTRELATPG